MSQRICDEPGCMTYARFKHNFFVAGYEEFEAMSCKPHVGSPNLVRHPVWTPIRVVLPSKVTMEKRAA